MQYYIGQLLGVLVTLGVIINFQFKKKRHMHIASLIINILSAANILLLDGFNSGVIVCTVAVIQLMLSIWHENKNTKASVTEKIIFLVLYVSGGVLGFHQPLDLLSIAAAVFYMLAVFQKKEQNFRIMLLCNMSIWTVYHTVLGSTAVFAQIAGIISSLVALYRYRNKAKSI